MIGCNGLVRSSFFSSLVALGAIAAGVASADDALFESSIRPVLVDTCFRCHGGERVSGGLRVDSREALVVGGDSGPAIVPGDPASSILVQAIARHGDVSAMPPEAEKALLPEQVAAFERWISADALWPAAAATFEIEGHWAFAPVTDPPAPTVADEAWCQTTVDRFIRARQEEAGASPPPRADRRTLIRRATFDLTGLPPTPEEVEAFVADPSPRAFDTVVERLLASTAYGEKWARHWLDVVRYADTAGETADYPVPVAWRYRNYCVDAFNRDLPYDEFLREQIAGDILAATGPEEVSAERIVATGFLAISRRFGFDSEKYHHLTIQDTIDTLGATVMGLSIGCARCHDHKFDPVSARDYYALYGIFESSRYPFPGSEQKQRVRSLAPLGDARADGHVWRAYEAEVSRLSAELAAIDKPVPAATLRSVTDLDGDFELQAPAGGGSYGVLVPPWRYEGPINVTAAAQSPFKHLFAGGRCGVSIAAGAGPYRCTQAVHGLPENGDPVFLNLDLRLHTPAPATSGRHRFTLSVKGNAAIELLLSPESLSLVAAGAAHDLGPIPAAEWINLQLAIDTTTHEVSGRFGSPGNVRDFGPFPLAADVGGPIEGPIDSPIDSLELEALVEPATDYAATALDCDNLALQSTPIPPVSLERPASIAGPDAKALRARLRELSGYDGDLEMQSAGAPPVAPWNPGPASVVRLDAKAQSPFTNLYPAGRLGLTLPGRTEYDGFGLSLPPISPDSQGRLHVSFDIRPGKRVGDSQGTWRYSIGHGPGPSPAIEMFFDDAAFFTRDGQTTSPVATLVADRWHQVQLVLDLAKRTYTGLLLSQGISTPFSGPLAASWDGIIDYTFIDSYGHVGGLRPALDVDNFFVSSTPPRPLDSPAEVPAAAAGRDEEIASLKSTLATLEARGDALAAELRRLLAEGPVPMAYAMAEGTPADARIQRRGEPDDLGDTVPRGFIAVLGEATIPAAVAGSGRLELAEWLTRPDHPLTARVMVNRIWQHHFGRGLVATPNDFGVRGRPPTHPELLDRLATDFVRAGWSIKAMHRLLMCSQAYQQDSRVSPSMADQSDPRLIDPENRLLWRANIQRLEAEQIRDAMLSVSGWLNPQIGGKTIPLLNKQFVFNHTSKDATSYETPRRAVYLPIIRNNLYDMLEQFDYPDPTMPTGSRNSTIVAPQALIMMNAPVAMQSAQKLAARLHDESTDERRVQRLFALLFSRSPTPEEQRRVLALLSDPQAANSPSEAWAQVCQTLLAANEFMYLR